MVEETEFVRAGHSPRSVSCMVEEENEFDGWEKIAQQVREKFEEAERTTEEEFLSEMTGRGYYCDKVTEEYADRISEAEDYMRHLVDETDFDVDVDSIRVVSFSAMKTMSIMRMQLTNGWCSNPFKVDSDVQYLAVSKNAFDYHDTIDPMVKQDWRAVIRHELAHIIAFEEIGDHDESDEEFTAILKEIDAPFSDASAFKEDDN